MRTRHFARTIVLQSLFEFDAGGWSGDPHEVLDRAVEEYAPKSPHRGFMTRLLDVILAKKDEIDAVIVKAAPEWPIEQIAVIDRNVLRMGLAELLFGDRSDVPPKVALNEAIELAKEFGGDASSKFVNGVLGSVYKDIGEPQKEEGVARKTEAGNIKTEELVGAFVYARHDERIYVCLVHDVFGYWTVVKGVKKADEDLQAAVVRKVKEEVGLEGVVKTALGSNEYTAHTPEEGRTRRVAEYFLVETPHDDIQLKRGGGLDDARWFKITDLGSLKVYDDLLPVMTGALNALANEQ
jgi:N utilization substance protein B